jgi:D-xylose 1-dehydrogenase
LRDEEMELRARYPSLMGRTVIVTGGASGIGAAIVSDFARQGARVAFLDKEREAGQALCETLVASNAPAPMFVECDLVDIAGVRAGLARIEAALGPAAVLVNNAACDQRRAFSELTVEEFDWMIAVNLRHAVFIAQAVVPQMQAIGFGSIINLTSVAWMRGLADMQAYSAAKAALVGFTNSLARQVGTDRIRVNALAPGFVLTLRQREKWFSDEAKVAEALAPQAIPDPIAPEDISALTMFLAADDSRMVTKQCIAVNAGSW